MALFGKKKNIEEKETEKTVEDNKASDKKVTKSSKKDGKPAKVSSKTAKTSQRDLTWILKGPRITEKGANIAEFSNSYSFNIDVKATKTDVKQAIEHFYKVSPQKVAIVKIPSKKVQVRGVRGKTGVKGGGKKAYVSLRKGDKIEFV